MQSINFHTQRGWMNDPNGFIYYKGEYHLFYQYFPHATQWGTICWGHAISPDLVNWEQKDIALFPSKPADQNGCFSGSAVESGGKLRLFYTGVHYDEFDPEDINKCVPGHFTSAQLTIESSDGKTFNNFDDKYVIIPPIDDPELGDATHTRDPKVWQGADGWYLVLGSNIHRKQGEILFYKSQDLMNWEYVSRTLMDPQLGWMCECPDLFEVEGGTVLLASLMGYEGGDDDQSVCFVVDYNKDDCSIDFTGERRLTDYGHDFYAPQTTTDATGRRVMVGWMRMPEPIDNKWIGMFTAPRVIEVVDGHTYFRLHPNIRRALTQRTNTPTHHRPYLFGTTLREGDHIDFGGLRVWQDKNRVHVDRSKVYRPRENFMHMHSETPEVGTENKIEMLVHGHIVEIYVNDGEYVISNMVYGLGNSLSTNSSADFTILGL